MNCFVHQTVPAVGVCISCQRAACRDCIARDGPRVVCRACVRRGIIGYEYKSAAAIGPWPFVHVCMGIDPATMRPRVARGVIAIGNFAVGVVALGGVAWGLIAIAVSRLDFSARSAAWRWVLACRLAAWRSVR
jgi:hypothetical protein